MSVLEYSKIPELHRFLSLFPFPVSWHEVITTYPALHHCYWSIFFAIIAGLVQLLSYLISKAIARRIIGYDKYPPLPTRSKVTLSSYYLKLGLHVNHKRHIKIHKYDIGSLSKTVCDSKLSPSEITKWLIHCNEFHAKNRLQRKKFQEYLYPIMLKSAVLYYGCYIVYDQPWLYDRALFYDGWPYNQQLDCCIPDIKLLYLFHMGFYVYRIFSSIFIDRQLKDFIASLIHHVVSFVLLVLSYYSGFIRIGTVILLLHDPADIVLQSAKFFKLIKVEILCNFFFALLCVTWLSSRVIIYPYHCVLSGFIDFWRLHPDADQKTRWMAYLLTALMCVLYCLHLHWFKLLIEAVLRIVRGHGVKDGRSDNDTDSEGEKNSKSKSKSKSDTKTNDKDKHS